MATFAPQEERPINYNVIVRVRSKPTPLQLNVKGEGYALSPSLLLELPDDSSLELSSTGVNTVDFGQVCVRDSVAAACLTAQFRHSGSSLESLMQAAAASSPPSCCVSSMVLGMCSHKLCVCNTAVYRLS